MNLTLPDWLGIAGLVLGLVGTIVGVLSIALAIWIYGKANEVNEQVIRTQAEIAGTTSVLKTLVDGLLGTAFTHVTKQNEAMIDKLTAVQANVAIAPSTDGKADPTLEQLQGRLESIRQLVLTLSETVKADLRDRSLPAWARTAAQTPSDYLLKGLGLPTFTPTVSPHEEPQTVAPSASPADRPRKA